MPPTAKRWQRQNPNNSPNQFLNFIHYFASGARSRRIRLRPEVASKSLRQHVESRAQHHVRIGGGHGRRAAAGLPVIATCVGGLPDIFGPQSSRLVPPGNAVALAEAIDAALADPVEVKRVAAIIQARVRSHFTIDAMVDLGLAAYREALAKQKAQQFA